MPAIVTPALALRYLRELSTDLRAAVMLDRGGHPLAGDEAAAAPASELLGVLEAVAGDGGRELLVRLEQAGRLSGFALAARGADGVALVLAAGPHVLLELLRHDAAQALTDLAARPPAPLGGGDRAPVTTAARQRSTAGGDAAPAVPPMPSTCAAAVVAVTASRGVQVLDAAGSPATTAISAGSRLLALGGDRRASAIATSLQSTKN